VASQLHGPRASKFLTRVALTPRAGSTRYPHIIFCLDESGSMSGEPFQDLIAAFARFWRTRTATQAMGEIVSVIQFASQARRVYEKQPLRGEPLQLSQVSGGTMFVPPLVEAESLIRQTCDQYDPVLIFMTDGQSGDHDAAVSKMDSMASAFSSYSFQAHSVPFGSSSPNVQALARPAKNYHKALTGTELEQVFAKIAGNMGVKEASDSIYREVATSISSQVQNKLVDEFL